MGLDAGGAVVLDLKPSEEAALRVHDVRAYRASAVSEEMLELGQHVTDLGDGPGATLRPSGVGITVTSSPGPGARITQRVPLAGQDQLPGDGQPPRGSRCEPPASPALSGALQSCVTNVVCIPTCS